MSEENKTLKLEDEELEKASGVLKIIMDQNSLKAKRILMAKCGLL